MNPYRADPLIPGIVKAFYQKYYADQHKRYLILGINPGRLGAGTTGIPFTDTKRLVSHCHIPYPGKQTHEPSAVFMHEMFMAFGGLEKFYGLFYIHSLFPLALTTTTAAGKQVNYNYYDSEALKKATRNAIIANVREQISFGIRTDTCFCLGTGKNEQFLRRLNEEQLFFERIIALEHPRYIMQYKLKEKQFYIDKYLAAFAMVSA